MTTQALLENHYSPGELKFRIGEFVKDYNHKRYHESLKNLILANVYTGRGPALLDPQREDQTETLSEAQTNALR